MILQFFRIQVVLAALAGGKTRPFTPARPSVARETWWRGIGRRVFLLRSLTWLNITVVNVWILNPTFVPCCSRHYAEYRHNSFYSTDTKRRELVGVTDINVSCVEQSWSITWKNHWLDLSLILTFRLEICVWPLKTILFCWVLSKKQSKKKKIAIRALEFFWTTLGWKFPFFWESPIYDRKSSRIIFHWPHETDVEVWWSLVHF